MPQLGGEIVPNRFISFRCKTLAGGKDGPKPGCLSGMVVSVENDHLIQRE